MIAKLRTFAPFVSGYVVAWLIKTFGPMPNDMQAELETALTLAVGAVIYVAGNWAVQQRWFPLWLKPLMALVLGPLRQPRYD